MLQKLLTLKDIGHDCYCSQAHHKNFRNALFGGQAIAQSLMAAGKTVIKRPPHSLHAYFLRPGKADTPVQYHVERVRDGRSVSTRTVKAFQNDVLIFTMQASFHQAEEGINHSSAAPSDTKTPDTLREAYTAKSLNYLENLSKQLGLDPLEVVPFNDILFNHESSTEDFSQFWVKSAQNITLDPLYHYCALAFASDAGLLATALIHHSHSLFGGEVIPASMDHAIWFHTQPNFNHWNRYVTESPWAGGARALCNGKFFGSNDQLIATVAQEGIIRAA